MECEMCGKAGANMRAKVEGIDMTLCERCSHHGTNVRSIAPTPKPKARREPLTQRIHEPEMIEAVHPDIARLLREHRERLHLTQEEFARRLNMRVSVYSHYENGSTPPSIAQARALERELKQSLVVKLKVSSSGAHAHSTGGGMTFGDLIGKK